MRAYARPSWLALIALAVSAAVAGAQSLGELAAKEKERQEKERQKRGGASKVITESDLGGRKGGTLSNAGATSEASPQPSASASPGAAKPAEAKEKTPEEIRADQENDWRQRIGQARDEVTQLSDKLNRLQTALNDVSGNIYSAPRTSTLQDFETTKAALTAARQKVSDLEEEGRRNSYR